MSLHSELTELTPLRRNHLRLNQQQRHQSQLVDDRPEHHQQQQPSSTHQLQSTNFSEYSSIKSNNNNNNHPTSGDLSAVAGDSATGVINPDNNNCSVHHSNLSIIIDREANTAVEMSDTSRVVTRITIDFVILLLVGLPILAFFLWGDPYKRGFYCNDESLMHPFHDSTVRSWMLYVSGLILPIGLISATEIIQAKLNKIPTKTKLQVFDWSVPTWIINAYRQIGVFGFGAAVSQLTTDIAKYSIGRLRPHFFSVCQPIMTDGTNCSNPINLGRYIEEFMCVSSTSNERMLKEMRLSFPSGHSSFSTYTMIYCAIYLQSRMTWRGSKLVKHFLQYVLIMIAWFTCMSRISDYKHHWSDVLVGALIGLLVAILIANFVADLGCRRGEDKNHNGQMRYELGSHATTMTTTTTNNENLLAYMNDQLMNSHTSQLNFI